MAISKWHWKITATDFACCSRASVVIFGSDLGKNIDLWHAGGRRSSDTEKWEKFYEIHDDAGLCGRWSYLPCFPLYYCASGEKSTDQEHHKITQDYTIAKGKWTLLIWLTFHQNPEFYDTFSSIAWLKVISTVENYSECMRSNCMTSARVNTHR